MRARRLPTRPTAQREARRRQRCTVALSELAVPSPFSVRDFCRSVEERSGTHLGLHGMPVGWAPAGLCGLLVETATANHIFFTRQPSVLAQATTIVHECGHILIPDVDGHLSTELPAGLADLVPDEVRAVHGRTGFSAEIEATVELFASIVLDRASAGDFDEVDEPAPTRRLVERFG